MYWSNSGTRLACIFFQVENLRLRVVTATIKKEKKMEEKVRQAEKLGICHQDSAYQ